MIGYTISDYQKLYEKDNNAVNEIIKELKDNIGSFQQSLNALVTINDFKTDLIFNHPLSNIPYVAKDNITTKDIKTTASSKMLNNYIPFFNATVIEKLNQNKAMLVAKSSMDELGLGGTNLSAITGPVANPWDITRISGGSSGGSAAIVASGIVPYSLGTDTGDSIRKPAAYCGIVGMKPTWGLISRYGVIPYASSLDHVGAFTRGVEDMAIVLGSIAGYDPKDMTSHNAPVPNYFANLNSNIKDKKIVVIKNIYENISNETIKNNFINTINLCKELGASVEEIDFNEQLLSALLPVYVVIANSEATSNHANLDGVKYGLRVEGNNVASMMTNTRTEGFSFSIRSRFLMGSYALAKENQEKIFLKAKKIRRLIVDEVNKILNDCDAILVPASASIAPKIEAENHQSMDSMTNWDTKKLSKEYLFAENHLVLANFAGTPSITIPSGFCDGMPIGINLMGKLFDEQNVLNIALALEEKQGLKNIYCNPTINNERGEK